MRKILKTSSYIFAILLSFLMGYKYCQFETDFNRTEAVHSGNVALVYNDKKEILVEGSNTHYGVTRVDVVKILEGLGYVCKKESEYSISAQKGKIVLMLSHDEAYLNGEKIDSSVGMDYFNDVCFISAIQFYDIIKKLEPNITGMELQFGDVELYINTQKDLNGTV